MLIKIILFLFNLRLLIFILVLIIFIKIEVLIILIIGLISTFINFYIIDIPFEEFFFDIRISKDLFLLDPRVYNLVNYKFICENISLSYNARKTQ
jgi:hypothetical protein